MKKLSDIDKNFKPSFAGGENMTFFDCENEPFKIYGIYKESDSDEFIRMPQKIAKKVNEGVEYLNYHTAGGRLRFSTDSQRIAIKCIWKNCGLMPHMPASGICGFDLYDDDKYLGSFVPSSVCTDEKKEVNIAHGYECMLDLGCKKTRNLTINFPLYGGVSKLYIGIDDDSSISCGKEYPNKKPIVFYGSSITQGGCASRPGNCYQSILSRWFDFDFVNLGFSGSARGEEEIANYIASMEMSAFVYDYDHNAPDINHLENTHYNMYKIIRQTNPDIPIITASAPFCAIGRTEDEFKKREDIIKQTVKQAKDSGDKNIYFVSGSEIAQSIDPEIMTVDSCHPNDFGFYCMAKKFQEVFKNLF